jgi:hypothetical protein
VNRTAIDEVTATIGRRDTVHVARRVELGLPTLLVLNVVLGEPHPLRDLFRKLLVEVSTRTDLLIRLLRVRGAVDDAEGGRGRVVLLVGSLLVRERLVSLASFFGGSGGGLVPNGVGSRRDIVRTYRRILTLARRLEEAGNDALNNPALSPVVDEDSLHNGETLDVELLEELDALKVLPSGVTARLASSLLSEEPSGVLSLGVEEVAVEVGVGGRGLVRV